MNPKQIKRCLTEHGIRQRDLARKFGIDEAMVSQVISGSRNTRYIQEAIANIVGKPVEEIWPEEKIRNLIKEAREISNKLHRLIKQKRSYRKAA